MAGQQCPKRNRRSRNAKALRRAVVGLIASAGAFLAFGMTPLAMTPSAHADEFDLIIDPIINSLSSVDPTLAVDMTSWLANLDSALAAASSFDPSSLAGAAATAESTSLGSLSTDVSSASAANPSDTLVQGLEQDWMNSSLGQQVDSSLNAWFNQADPAQVNPAADPTAGTCGLICNGANGTGGGTLTEADGQGGGLLFGDGGNGGLLFDNGGNGGIGGAGEVGGSGGAGGTGGLFGLAGQHGANGPSGDVVATVHVGKEPEGVAVSPTGPEAGDIYITNFDGGAGDTVSVIDPSTNEVVATIDVGGG